MPNFQQGPSGYQYRPPQIGGLGGSMTKPVKQPPVVDTRPVPPGYGGAKPGPGYTGPDGPPKLPGPIGTPGYGGTNPGQGGPSKPWAGVGGLGGGPQLGGGLLLKPPPIGGPGYGGANPGINPGGTMYGGTKPMPAPWTPPPIYGELPPGMNDRPANGQFPFGNAGGPGSIAGFPTKLPPQGYGVVDPIAPSGDIWHLPPPQFDIQPPQFGPQYGEKPKYGKPWQGMPTGGYKPPAGIMDSSFDQYTNPISLQPPVGGYGVSR